MQLSKKNLPFDVFIQFWRQLLSYQLALILFNFFIKIRMKEDQYQKQEYQQKENYKDQLSNQLTNTEVDNSIQKDQIFTNFNLHTLDIVQTGDSCKMAFKKDTDQTLFGFLLVHSNQKEMGHLYRAAYIDQFTKKQENVQNEWPLLRNQCADNQGYDQIAVRFSIFNKNTTQYISMGTRQKIKFYMKKDKACVINLKQLKNKENQKKWLVSLSIEGSAEQFSSQILTDKFSNFNMFTVYPQDKKQELLKEQNPLTMQQTNSPQTDAMADYKLTKLQIIAKIVREQILKRKQIQNQQSQIVPETQKKLNPILIKQSKNLGNCFFIAVLLQLISKAPFIIHRIWTFQSKKGNYAVVFLNIDGSVIPIKVDLEVLARQSVQEEGIQTISIYYAGFANIDAKSDEDSLNIVLKAMIIEKALAKVYENYRYIEGGLPLESFMILTNSCAKSYLSNQDRQYIGYMKSWMIQYRKNRKIQPQKTKVMKFDITGNSSKQQQHCSQLLKKNLSINLIVVSFGDIKDKLEDLFSPFLKDKQKLSDLAYNFHTHTYSFQGIYNSTQSKDPKTIFIKLRDPRGQKAAKYWRLNWSGLSAGLSQNVKERYYNYKKIYIFYGEGEFVLTLANLISLNCKIRVCQYHTTYESYEHKLHWYESWSYKSFLICVGDNKFYDFQLTLPQPNNNKPQEKEPEEKRPKVQIALHQINKRRYLYAYDNDLASNQELQKIYHQVSFTLQQQNSGRRVYFIEDYDNYILEQEQEKKLSQEQEHPAKANSITFFEYYLSPGTHKISVGLKSKWTHYCFLSFLTDSVDTTLDGDYKSKLIQRENAIVQWFKQKQEYKLDYHKNTGLHKIKIPQQEYLRLRIYVQLSWSFLKIQKQSIKMKQLVRLVFEPAKFQNYYGMSVPLNYVPDMDFDQNSKPMWIHGNKETDKIEKKEGPEKNEKKEEPEKNEGKEEPEKNDGKVKSQDTQSIITKDNLHFSYSGMLFFQLQEFQKQKNQALAFIELSRIELAKIFKDKNQASLTYLIMLE